MDKRELAYAKQTVTNVKDWDAFQTIIRFLAQMVKPVQQPVVSSDFKKI